MTQRGRDAELRGASGAWRRARRGGIALLLGLGVCCAVGVYVPALLAVGSSRSELIGGGASTNSDTSAKLRHWFDHPRRSFLITGSVGGLYPGAELPLRLTVTNPRDSAITVTSLTVSVADASHGCRAADLKVSSFSGKLRVGARASSSVTVDTTLEFAAPNACEGATFPLTYVGVAEAS